MRRRLRIEGNHSTRQFLLVAALRSKCCLAKSARGSGSRAARVLARLMLPLSWGKPAMRRANILVVDDDADFRWLLLTLLEADPRVRVAGEAADGEAAWTSCARKRRASC